MKKQLVIPALVAICAINLINAQTFGNRAYDHVFAANGGAKLTLATGIPYIGIAEYAYGFSEKITGGLLWGLTPNVEGYGVRVRAVVYQETESFRVYFCTPILYYPKTKELGGDPWWLTRPNINFEWITSTKFRYKFGGSIIAAASHHSLFGDPSKAKLQPGFCNAMHVGISLPIGSGIMFQTELSAVMSGLQIAGKDWVGGFSNKLITSAAYAM